MSVPVRRAGFSILEMLVVLVICMGVMAAVSLTTTKQQAGAKVRAAAEELASVLRDTRHRALKEHATYAVAFNIQNAPGSSGRVLNNRGGGHWYRVIGPSHRTRYPDYTVTNNIPCALGLVGANSDREQRWLTGNFPDFIDDVEQSWVSEPHVLPAGRVRFLALSDTDEGPRRVQTAPQDWYGTGGATTYPRPWFGYFDPATRRLWPWGGYDPTIPGSGFCYQGADGPIADSCNPSDKLVDHDWDAKDVPDPQTGSVVIADTDRDNDGDTTDPREQEIGWPIWRQGSPRAVVNAAWLDACIIFQPNGEVAFGEWNRARRAYQAATVAAGNTTRYFNGFDGIPAMAKATGNPWRRLFTGVDWCYGTSEVGHFDRHTGGFRITLGPDSPHDADQFASAEEAAESVTPAWRVSVSCFGIVTAFPVQHRKGYLKSLPAGSCWPPDPDDWSATSTTSPLFLRCQNGWLNAPFVGWVDPRSMTPTGQPIVDILDPDMMSKRVWWKE